MISDEYRYIIYVFLFMKMRHLKTLYLSGGDHNFHC